MNNKQFSRYRNINSFIHIIDPVTKVIAFLAIVIMTFFAQSLGSLIFVFVFVFIISLLSRIRFKSYFKLLLIILPFFILMSLLYLLITWGWNNPKDTFILTGKMSIRFYELILLATILTTTTKEMQIANGIEFIISPLRIIKVPTYEISMMIMLAIRFIPILLGDLQKIMIAQTSRGVNVVNGNFRTKIKGIKNALLPMFVIAFKRADDMSFAMIMRGYEINKKRSKYDKTKFFIPEWITTFVTSMMFLFIIYLQFFTQVGEWY